MNRTRPGKAQVGKEIRPALWCSGMVRLSARVLPRGPVRDRYRDEFLAELHDMPRTRQARHAVGILSQALALRMAVTSKLRLAGGTEDMRTHTSRRPLLCRLNVHHAWRTHSTEDGALYRRCARCGKDDEGDHDRGNAIPMNTGGFPLPGG